MSIITECECLTNIDKKISELQDQKASYLRYIMGNHENLLQRIKDEVHRVEKEYNLAYHFSSPYLGTIVSEYTVNIGICGDDVYIHWEDNIRYDRDEGGIRIPLSVFENGNLDYIEQAAIDYKNEKEKEATNSQLKEYLKLKAKFEGTNVE